MIETSRSSGLPTTRYHGRLKAMNAFPLPVKSRSRYVPPLYTSVWMALIVS
jgi:hypothetical protein